MIYQSDAASNFSHKFARKQMQVSEECHTYTGRLAHFILYNLIYIYIISLPCTANETVRFKIINRLHSRHRNIVHVKNIYVCEEYRMICEN